MPRQIHILDDFETDNPCDAFHVPLPFVADWVPSFGFRWVLGGQQVTLPESRRLLLSWSLIEWRPPPLPNDIPSVEAKVLPFGPTCRWFPVAQGDVTLGYVHTFAVEGTARVVNTPVRQGQQLQMRLSILSGKPTSRWEFLIDGDVFETIDSPGVWPRCNTAVVGEQLDVDLDNLKCSNVVARQW